MRLTPRQRENLAKIFINTGNGFLIAWVLGSFAGHEFQLSLLLWGLGLYIVMATLAILVDR